MDSPVGSSLDTRRSDVGAVLLVLVAGLLLGPEASAVGPPRLVADLAQSAAARSSFPQEIHRVGDRVVFAASDPVFGFELRSTAASPPAAGQAVELLVDATPGTAHSTVRYLAAFDGVLAYGLGSVNGADLFVTDGTRAGTHPAIDASGSRLRVEVNYILPEFASLEHSLIVSTTSATSLARGVWAVHADGSAESLLQSPPEEGRTFAGLAAVGDRAFFQEEGAPVGAVIWSTDGTKSGTEAVGLSSATDSVAAAGANGRYFVAGYGDHGEVLVASDGTQAGTAELAAFGPYPEIGPRFLYAGPSRVYFVAGNGAGPDRLWMSDGTPAGTVRVARPGEELGFGFEGFPHAWVGERFIFLASTASASGLWFHDGSAQAPVFLAEPVVDPESPLLELDGQVLFFAYGGNGLGEDLWSTDGTAGGSRRVTGFCPPYCSSYYPIYGTRVGERAIFQLVYESSMLNWNWALVTSDGTEAGTRVLSDSATAAVAISVASPGDAAPVVGGLLAGANDESTGWEPWFLAESDGSLLQVANLEPEIGTSHPRRFLSAGDQLSFVADPFDYDPRGYSVVPAHAQPEPVPSELCGYGDIAPLVEIGSRLLYADVAYSYSESESRCLVARDLVSGEWETLISTGDELTLATPYLRIGDRVAFSVPGGSYADPLWFSDGTGAGTGPSTAVGLPQSPELLAATSTHLFLRDRYGFFTDLYSLPIGGTSAAKIASLTVLEGENQGREEAAVGSRYYFTTREPGSIESLRVSDGTAAGTLQIWSSQSDERILDLFPDGDVLFFLVASERARLWRTDGSVAGTRQIVDLGSLATDPDDDLSRPSLVFDGHLFFVAETDATGAELWSTDGTAAGTGALDLVPGPAGSDPRWLAEAGGRLFFTAEEPGSGREVWASDGSLAGTRRVTDVAPGPLSFQAEELTSVGATLFFAADDGFRGRELWALDADATPLVCDADSSRLCLEHGRFAVEALWRDFQGHTGVAQAMPISDDAGFFWFFDARDLELGVKVLDACGLPEFENFWVFATGLTNVEVSLSVVDTITGQQRTYENPLGTIHEPIHDTSHFRVCGASLDGEAIVPPVATEIAESLPLQSIEGCVVGPSTLCLLDGRFEVTLDWATATQSWGVGHGVPISDQSGYFWFFEPANLELLIKMIDGCDFNQRYWLFAGGLTDLATHFRIRDTATPGAVFERFTEPGEPFRSILSIDAFATCP